ncbi:MAG: thymidine phosphorylase [bacterium]|nr:MAG: thymidine phosphorylase [bacterium]
MTPYEIIRRKRDNETLSRKEIFYFVDEFMRGRIKDYQMSAFLMAVFYQGLNDEETLLLTEAYLRSGKTINLDHLAARKIDKHSTGGVGDKVSIILAPLAASLGVLVPMISGRGLGHTGGTLDKLESIPGFKVTGSIQRFKKQMKEIGVAMYGQSEFLVPADRKIYALRDVTATVDSIPLITASIMSKKLAAGIDGLVLDVKVGNGSFIPRMTRAEQLARNLIRIGQAFGKKVTTYLTSMDQPLGNKIGNWLEIEECLDCLKGEGPKDLVELTVELTTEMMILADLEKKRSVAKKKCFQALNDGSALKKFLELVKFQGGNIELLLHPERVGTASYSKKLTAAKDGFISQIDTYRLGVGSVHLGAGRFHAGSKVDPQAGLILYKKIGDPVKKGEVILELRSNKQAALEEAEIQLDHFCKIQPTGVRTPELVRKRLSQI